MLAALEPKLMGAGRNLPVRDARSRGRGSDPRSGSSGAQVRRRAMFAGKRPCLRRIAGESRPLRRERGESLPNDCIIRKMAYR